MNKTYDPLFTPWKIGNVEIKNRIVMTSMGGTSIFGWMEPNHFDKEAARFLLERAKNNAGLILPGIAPIRDILLGKWLYQGKGKFDELKDFMEEFHKTGCKMFIQLTAGFGRSLAINDIMVKAMHNKALATVMQARAGRRATLPPAPAPHPTAGRTAAYPAPSPQRRFTKW